MALVKSGRKPKTEEEKAAEAAALILRRRKAQETFVDFCRELAPHEPPAKHHQMLCDALDEVARGENDRLMVFMPPGSAKSTYASRRFPAYFLGKYPDKSIISASYGEGLATGFGKEVRNIVNSREYNFIFDTQLSEDSRAKGEWETKQGGSYYAVGVGSGVTGRRADCLPGDTIVITGEGEKRIDEIDITSKTCYILSYDKKPVYSRVLAIVSREAEATFRIHTQSGRVVEATGNHRIYTQSGYVRACDIAEGTVLLSLVPEGVCSNSLRLSKEVKEKYARILFNVLRGLSLERFQWKSTSNLQNLWSSINFRKPIKVLWRCLQKNSKEKIRQKEKEAQKHRMWFLWDRISPSLLFDKILWDGLQERRTCFAHDGQEQSRLAQWHESFKGATSFSQNVSESPPKDYRKGWWQVCGLLKNKKTPRPSHQSKSIRQSLGQFSDFVRRLSSKMACWRTVKAKEDTVVLVERLYEPKKVFDLQVERTECFFANGILVHNCLILDDPVKGREAADSETERNRIWNWYLSDYISRFKLGQKKAQIIVQTRWHQDDLSGRILPKDWDFQSGTYVGFDGQKWKVICFPAQAESDDVLGRKKGEWLWPEDTSPEEWEEIKQTQMKGDVRNWSALYQQRPQPESGVFFKREWFQRFHLGEEPKVSKYGATDYAVTKGGGDSTEHGIGGFDEDKHLWMLDWWSGQETLDVSIEEQVRLAKLHHPYSWISEVGVIRRAVEPFLVKRQRDKDGEIFRMEWFNHIGDKGAHARSIQAMASQGMVHIPYCDWGEALIDQLVKFIPNTNYQDDKVDVMGHFGRKVDSAFTPTEIIKEKKIVRDSYGFDEDEVASWKLM